MKFRIAAIIYANLIILLSSCENDLEEVNRIVSQNQLNVETMREVEMYYSDSAIIRVKVMGPVMLRYVDQKNPQEEFPEGVIVDFFDPLGRKQSKLTANYAIRKPQLNKVIVRDSVVWQSVNNERLETEELIWDQRGEKIYSNKFVTITKPDEIIYGVGFETDQNFEQWRIKAPEGEIMVEKE